ncbi:MAG TPA: hypothetical protein VN428_08070 [Bryobacteraceae bacterium]|nr:hypothetical protein [Bryobacteraceae bacterium]
MKQTLMRRSSRVLIAALCLLLVLPVWGRQDPSVCGTYRGRLQEELYRHKRNVAHRARLRSGTRSAGVGTAGVAAGPVYATRPDAGDIAIVEASDGVVAVPNTFDLNGRTVTFTPSGANAAAYSVSSGPGSYDAQAETGGQKVPDFGDDEAQLLTLPFRFPFFGRQYGDVFINSDGNLTFGAWDTSSSERSLGRFNSGPPRIAALFDDLDPSTSSQGVRVLTSSSRVVISWVGVPEWTPTGPSGSHTFQLRLYPDGKVEFAWWSSSPNAAVVGIAPGGLTGNTNVVDLTNPVAGSLSGSIGERFGTSDELDFVTIAQKFYATHDDAYDYLVIFNGLRMADSGNSLASTRPIRVGFSGNGDTQVDFGKEFGSPSRLQALIHMAYPGQYPDDLLNTKLWNLGRGTDTSIGVLAHEVGHLWMAYASVADPNGDPDYSPMLGFGASHWSFNFNSEASLLEGNKIQDNGSGGFLTTRATEVYSGLDQYLMGLRAPEDVMTAHPMFYVANARNASGPVSNSRHPALNVALTGERRNVDIGELLSRYGRRIPDQTVSQKRFRLAFILVVPKDQQPADGDLEKINRFRTMFEPYFEQAAQGRASGETTLRRAMHLSTFPAAGVLRGGSVTAKITVETPSEANLTVSLNRGTGVTNAPASVTIPAGATSATFTLDGLRVGVEELVATPSDGVYETVRSNIQVLDSASELKVTLISGGNQIARPNTTLLDPLVLRVVDRNNLPYPGIRVNASVRTGGQLDQNSAVSDENGLVQFRWTPGDSPLNELKVTVEGAASSGIAYAWSRPAFEARGVVNAASFLPGTAPGSLASLFGVNLATAEAYASRIPLPFELGRVQVLVKGLPVPLLYVSPLQINFVMPAGTPVGSNEIIVVNTSLGSVGESAPMVVTVDQVAPAIFDDPGAKVGAIHVAGESVKTNARPARGGEYVEIYATGLGSVHATERGQETDRPVTVFLDGQPLTDVPYAGLNGNYVGLYQVNARVPAGKPAGRYPVVLEIGGKSSLPVFIQVQ